ncbi:glycoside hydrolase family 2 protein [soil metagenome]
MPGSVALDRWALLDFTPGEGLVQGAERGDGEGWMPIPAPGDAYLALIEAGRLAHPFKGRNEDDAAWVRDREWWQRTTFTAPEPGPDEVTELVLEGLDTFTSIYLDGELLGGTDNMFRRYVFDISDRVGPGDTHSLSIRFDPPALAVVDRPLPVWSAFTDRVSRSKRNQMRKAQFGWGWDWGPDLPTVGVWQAAWVETRARSRIDGVRFETLTASTETAHIRILIEAQTLAGGADVALTIEVALTDPDGAVVFTHRSPANAAAIETDIDRPRLWWTADLGGQPLYALTVRLFDGERLLEEAHQDVGVRTITLDESPDPDEPDATFFRFVLNGVPIFAKGACWVPTTSFVGDVGSEPYDRLLEQAARANMNMIRVWGGGIYEPDLFYDLCDRKGLLVWQDFMFACAHYPEDGEFAASVKVEVEQQVRRLRHHPCLALWCGNNESQAMNRINTDLGGEPVRLSGTALYDDLIPAVLARLDPEALYRPGSPWGGANPNTMRHGDVHNWTVWHGLPPIPDETMVGDYAVTPEGIAYSRYAEDRSRFVSEFGIQAAPALATLKRWMDPADLTPDSPGFLARIKDEAKKADAMISTVTGPATTIEDYVDFTQWTQAEGLKFGIEHFRRRTPHCSGALIWQFNDCWPCVSWSLVDYDGVEKAAYHAVRRAFAPVLASFKVEGEGVELWITNDTLKPVTGYSIVALDHLDGREVWSEAVQFAVVAGASVAVWSGRVAAVDDLVLTVRSPHEAFAANRYLPAPISRLALSPNARPIVAVEQACETECRVTLAAEVYLAFVHLTSARADLRFSDNHFDLAAGDRHTVVVTASTPFTADDFDIRCWNARS